MGEEYKVTIFLNFVDQLDNTCSVYWTGMERETLAMERDSISIESACLRYHHVLIRI
jgi:hypothetical protein